MSKPLHEQVRELDERMGKTVSKACDPRNESVDDATKAQIELQLFIGVRLGEVVLELAEIAHELRAR